MHPLEVVFEPGDAERAGTHQHGTRHNEETSQNLDQ